MTTEACSRITLPLHEERFTSASRSRFVDECLDLLSLTEERRRRTFEGTCRSAQDDGKRPLQ